MTNGIEMVGEATLEVEPTPAEGVAEQPESLGIKKSQAPDRPKRIYWFQANKPGYPGIRTAKLGRNQPCPCKSGKKYKNCCGSR